MYKIKIDFRTIIDGEPCIQTRTYEYNGCTDRKSVQYLKDTNAFARSQTKPDEELLGYEIVNIGPVDYRKCSAVAGPNTHQVWVYDEEHDTYIDPPSCVLSEIARRANDEYDFADWQVKEDLLDEIIATNPSWLQDEAYTYNGELDI